MSTSSIDDILTGSMGNSQQPQAPEHQDEVESNGEHDGSAPDYGLDDTENETTGETGQDEQVSAEESEEESDEAKEPEVDEYGNEKERMTKGMQDRLDRKEKKHQREIDEREREINALRAELAAKGASQQVQQAAKDFEYDPDSSGDWQQQLASFVKQTVKSMSQEETQEKQKEQELAVQREFQQKFKTGMERFDDFVEVVDSMPLDSAMTMALRGMNDPTAFLYAAAKRQPQELERISKLADPYARMVEMGKLEERMRRNKPTTKTPRPLGRASDDATIKTKPKEKEADGDILLARADAKRRAVVNTRLRNNR